ncbi:MAG: hypothetical protein ACRDWY_07340 [Actinomycetes bacterium]
MDESPSRWRVVTDWGVTFEVTHDTELEPPNQKVLFAGEGGKVRTAETARGFHLVTSEAAALDLLDPDDAARLGPLTVRRFSSDADRQRYLEARGWDRAAERWLDLQNLWNSPPSRRADGSASTDPS